MSATLAGQAERNYIAARARAAGLDPAAVLAVAGVEGGFSGSVGDAGTSFGPFQLHKGGALPSGLANPSAWANSAAGINYAIAQMANVARGLTGRAAVSAIVTRFERPLNPTAEVTHAMAGYKAPTPTTIVAVLGKGVVRNAPTGSGHYGLSDAEWAALSSVEQNSYINASAADRATLKADIDAALASPKPASTLQQLWATATGTGKDVAGGALGAASLLAKLQDKGTWVRVGEGVAGVLCAVGAVWMFANVLGVSDKLGKIASGLPGPAGAAGAAMSSTGEAAAGSAEGAAAEAAAVV